MKAVRKIVSRTVVLPNENVDTDQIFVASAGTEVATDVEAGELSFAGSRTSCPIEPFARYWLLNGLDELAFLLSREREIAAFEAARGPAPWRFSS